MIETTEWMDAVGLRLEPKWLRVIDALKYNRNDEQTDDESVFGEKPFSRHFALCGRMAFDVDIDCLISSWNKQKSCDTSEYVGAVCNHDLCAILEHDMLKQDELNVAGVTIVPKMMTDGQVCLAMLSSFVQSLVHMLSLADLINISQESVQ